MAKVVPFRFHYCLIPFTVLLVEGSCETRFLDIYRTTFFRIRNFRNTSAMRVIFFLKVFKICLHFKSGEKIEKKPTDF